jgi:hypothetical protein
VDRDHSCGHTIANRFLWERDFGQEVMGALLICGMLLFSGAATAQDRSSCFKNCDAIYYTCHDQCPGTTACVQRCVQQINECKSSATYDIPFRR